MTKANKKFEKVMSEFGKGKLLSNGKKVTHPDQALAIAFSEAKKIDKNFGKPKKQIGGLLSEQEGISEEEARVWFDAIFDGEEQQKFFDSKGYGKYKPSIHYDDLKPETKREWKEFLLIQSASKGLKLYGPSHAEGGIPGVIKESGRPIEVEGGEVIINKSSMKIREHIKCSGTPEGIASEINELGGGIKFSDKPGKCEYSMKKGSKVKELRNLNKEETIKYKSYLKDFISRYEKAENKSDYNELDYEYKDYVKENNLPFISADDLYVAILLNEEEKMKKGNKVKSYLEKGNKIKEMIIRDNELKEKAEQGMKVQEFIKINEPEVYEILRYFNTGHPTNEPITRFLWKGNDISIYQSLPALQEYLDKYSIYYSVFESKEELQDYLKTLLPSRIKNQL